MTSRSCSEKSMNAFGGRFGAFGSLRLRFFGGESLDGESSDDDDEGEDEGDEIRG